MGKRRRKLSTQEIQAALPSEAKPFLSPAEFATLLGFKSPKTIYQWIAQGRLDGAFRKRGKHNLICRDRAIKIIFNGKDWSNGKEQ